jgi:hypothetical protein
MFGELDPYMNQYTVRKCLNPVEGLIIESQIVGSLAMESVELKQLLIISAL